MVVPAPPHKNGHRNENQEVPPPPEQINNFVYESEENRLVLDFGDVVQLVDSKNPDLEHQLQQQQQQQQQSQLILDRLSSPGQSVETLLAGIVLHKFVIPCNVVRL